MGDHHHTLSQMSVYDLRAERGYASRELAESLRVATCVLGSPDQEVGPFVHGLDDHWSHVELGEARDNDGFQSQPLANRRRRLHGSW